MIKLKNSKYSNLMLITLLFLELYIIIFFVTGAQFNILSKTFIGALFLIHLEVTIGFFLRNHRSIVFYISIIFDVFVLSLYFLFVAQETTLFTLLFFLACLLLVFNRPFLLLLSKISKPIKIINSKLWPTEKPFTILTSAGALLIIASVVFAFLVWLCNMNQDYTENCLEQICIHEAGHAVITEELFPGKVMEVVWNPKVTHDFLSSIGLKNISLGYTRYSIETKFLSPKLTEDLVKVLLAGELSTKHFYGKNRLIGGGSDIPNAYNITQRYFKLTYSDELGTINRYDYDSKTLNDATKLFIDSQALETERLITKNSKLIKVVANELREKKRLTGAELRKIIKENKHVDGLNSNKLP